MSRPGIERGGENIDKQDPTRAYQGLFPQLPMPKSDGWPNELHKDFVRDQVEHLLPRLIDELSTPVQERSHDDLRAMFAGNPQQRESGWRVSSNSDGTLTAHSAYYEDRHTGGSSTFYYGLRHTFDSKGRLVNSATIDGGRSYTAGDTVGLEEYAYDEDGYLVRRYHWEQYGQGYTDNFSYQVHEDGMKTPVDMIRTVEKRTATSVEDGDSMTVDLKNHATWLVQNPNGIASIDCERLQIVGSVLGDYDTSERRSGVFFATPDELHEALVMHGSGNFTRASGRSALDENIKQFGEAHGGIGALMLLSSSMSQDMNTFVDDNIMKDVRDAWDKVHKPKLRGGKDEAFARYSFDYGGAGRFHKSSGNMHITKEGIVLEMHAAYVGSEVEVTLAKELGKIRALDSKTLKIGLNQASNEGYFYTDLREVCDELGLDISDQAIEAYLAELLGEGVDPVQAKKDRSMGRRGRSPLWSDSATGTTINLSVEDRDYESDVDLVSLYKRNGTELWGPYPRSSKTSVGSITAGSCMLVVQVKPEGDPFDERTNSKADDAIKRYISKVA